MIRRAEITLPKDAKRMLKHSLKRERDGIARLQLKLMLRNLELAERLGAPICQDTGTFTFFVKLGRELKLPFDLERAIRKAVMKATKEIPLRVNVVDPITREPNSSNTGRVQPAVHIEMREGKELEIDLLVKGGGTENYGRLFMMRPTEGKSAIGRAVLSVLAEARGKSCPPNIVGVGVGGSTETAPLLAKLALLRPLDRPNPDPELMKIEQSIERAANGLGTGPMGLGGRTTALRVLVEKAACHTASLPISVALQCWPARKAKGKMVDGEFRVVNV